MAELFQCVAFNSAGRLQPRILECLALSTAAGQRLIRMNGATGNRLAAYLRAEMCLQHAHADLDEIMRTLPSHRAEEQMASPALLLLLVRAVAARRHLNDAGAALELERT